MFRTRIPCWTPQMIHNLEFVMFHNYQFDYSKACLSCISGIQIVLGRIKFSWSSTSMTRWSPFEVFHRTGKACLGCLTLFILFRALKEATETREKEAEKFAAENKDSTDAIRALDSCITILKKYIHEVHEHKILVIFCVYSWSWS